MDAITVEGDKELMRALEEFADGIAQKAHSQSYSRSH